jgi:hypothetical protein
VLEALGGYLLIAHHLFQGDGWAATGWNFGPADDDTRPVHWIADRMTASWSALTGQPIGWDQPGDAAGRSRMRRGSSSLTARRRAQNWVGARLFHSTQPWHALSNGIATSVKVEEQGKSRLPNWRIIASALPAWPRKRKLMPVDDTILDPAALARDCDEGQLRSLILELTEQYANRFHAPRPLCRAAAWFPFRARSMARPTCAIWSIPAWISG